MSISAAAKGNVQVMRQLLKNPSVKVRRPSSHTLRVSGSSVDMCALWWRSAQLEERSNLGVTALHYAAGNGCIEAVELLLAVRRPLSLSRVAGGSRRHCLASLTRCGAHRS
jgi:ankyrin repeat protein